MMGLHLALFASLLLGSHSQPLVLWADIMNNGNNWSKAAGVSFMSGQCNTDTCARMPVLSDPTRYLETKAGVIDTGGYTDITLEFDVLFENFGQGEVRLYTREVAQQGTLDLVDVIYKSGLANQPTLNAQHTLTFQLSESYVENNNEWGIIFTTENSDQNVIPYVWIDNVIISGIAADFPTDEPTDAPTPEPTDKPSPAPSPSPTPSPTPAPSPSPTPNAPTSNPSPAPTRTPTLIPTINPTSAPTKSPQVTGSPSTSPTRSPTTSPITLTPTQMPTESDTVVETPLPTTENVLVVGKSTVTPGNGGEGAAEHTTSTTEASIENNQINANTDTANNGAIYGAIVGCVLCLFVTTLVIFVAKRMRAKKAKDIQDRRDRDTAMARITSASSVRQSGTGTQSKILLGDRSPLSPDEMDGHVTKGGGEDYDTGETASDDAEFIIDDMDDDNGNVVTAGGDDLDYLVGTESGMRDGNTIGFEEEGDSEELEMGLAEAEVDDVMDVDDIENVVVDAEQDILDEVNGQHVTAGGDFQHELEDNALANDLLMDDIVGSMHETLQ